MRKLIKALLTISILLPTLGFAVGLGDIHLHSNLNQQLNAEIDLLSVNPAEADKITASLASYDDFNKVGLDRPAVLMFLQFEVQKRPDGTPYIKIKSKESINEPFLDFLVEVTWPNGKVLREYTLLLDPPSMSTQQEPLFVEPPKVEKAPTVAATSQPGQKPTSPVEEPVVSAAPAGDMEAPPTEQAAHEPLTSAQEPKAAAQGAQTSQESQASAQETKASDQESQKPQGEQTAAKEQQSTQESAAGKTTVATAETKPVAAPEKATTKPSRKEATETVPVSAGNMTYGPVKRNETLSHIASKMLPDEGVTVDQMMIALYNSNREAFIQNNINLLRKGAVLRIEDPAALKALSQAEARREVARQGRAWEEYRSRVAAHTPKSIPAENTASASAKAGSAAAPAKEESKLTLVAPSKPGETKHAAKGGTSDKEGESESLRKELLLANEAAEARRKENEDLNKRLKELQGQLDQMQKLLTLKDDNLAAMQQKLAAQQKEAAAVTKGATTGDTKPGQPVSPAAQPAPAAAAAQPPKKTPQPSPVDPAKTPDEASPAAKSPAVNSPSPAGAVTAPATTSEAEKPATPVETPAKSESDSEAAKMAAEPVKPKPAPKKPKHVLPPAPPPEPSFIDQLLADPVMLGGGAAGVIILVLGIIALRRRQGRGFQESILTVGATSSMMGKGKGDNPASETSFLSDLAISGMGGRVQEESDVDPLTEADVYMAYNRFPQAEELLKEGLKHNPERDELHAKLLEVYYKSKNRAAFEQVAQARAATMQNNQSMWQKVVAMGHELAPDNPLFQGAAVAGGGAALFAQSNTTHPAADEVFDIGLDLDALSNEMEAEGSGGSDFVDLGLDFSDLGMDEDAKKKPEEPVAPAADLDFNFDLGNSADAPEAPVEQSSSLDFDLSSFDTSAPEASTAIPEESSLASGLDFDLSAMAEETHATEEPAASLDFGDFDLGSMATEAPAAEPESTFDLGSLDFGDSSSDLSTGTGSESIDFGALDLGGTSEDPAMDLADFGDFGDLSDVSGGNSLGDMDEVGTKLDLAKAYVDMGDSEGARGMLEEVMHEGSDDQKRQAKELLAQIA